MLSRIQENRSRPISGMLREADGSEPEISHFGHLATKSFGRDRLAPRGAGSTTGANMYDIVPHDTPVEEFRPHKDADFAGARYFKLHKKHVSPEVWSKLDARVGAKTYGELSPEERSMVKVRPGHAWGNAGNGDGRELYIDRPAHDKHLADTDHITFITGRDGAGWTYHPGSPMGVHDSDNKRGTAAHWKSRGHDPEHVASNAGRHIRPEDYESPNLKDSTAVKLHRG